MSDDEVKIVYEKINVANKNFFGRIDEEIELVCEISGGRSESILHSSTKNLSCRSKQTYLKLSENKLEIVKKKCVRLVGKNKCVKKKQKIDKKCSLCGGNFRVRQRNGTSGIHNCTVLRRWCRKIIKGNNITTRKELDRLLQHSAL